MGSNIPVGFLPEASSQGKQLLESHSQPMSVVSGFS